jgi:hypothetical protein
MAIMPLPEAGHQFEGFINSLIEPNGAFQK